MSDHVDRMKIEHKELASKCESLSKFIYSEDSKFKELCNLEQARMIMQLGFMNSYLSILESRIWVANK